MKDNIKILLKAIMAGIMISIGGTINLMLDNKIIGALLFSIGLYMICANSYNLYTGKIGYLVHNKIKYLIELLITLLGNLIGTIGVGYLLRITRISESIINKAKSLCTIKLDDTILSILILSFFCGILMFLAVDLYKKLDNVGKYLAIFLGVSVFILSGFEHCVANMYYFSVSNMWSLKTIIYMLIMILGNSLGSIFIAYLNNFVDEKN